MPRGKPTPRAQAARGVPTRKRIQKGAEPEFEVLPSEVDYLKDAPVPDTKAERLETFCQVYVRTNNGAKSARAAGYSPNGSEVAGCRLLANANVRARIAELRADITKNYKLDRDKMVELLLREALSEHRDGKHQQAIDLLARHLNVGQETKDAGGQGASSRTLENLADGVRAAFKLVIGPSPESAGSS